MYQYVLFNSNNNNRVGIKRLEMLIVCKVNRYVMRIVGLIMLSSDKINVI